MSNGASDTSSVGSSKDRSIGGDKKTNEQDSHHQQAEHENKSSTTKHKKHTHTKIDERKKRRLIANFDPTRQHEIRESNRVAARVCRKRKKQFSQSLEATLKVLDEENQQLTAQHDTLSSWVKMVRQEATTPANTTFTGLDTQERTETVGSVQEETGAGQLPKLVSNDTSSSSAQQDRNGNNVSNGSNGNNGNNGNSSGNNGNTTIDTSDNNVMPQVLPIPVYNTSSFQNAMYDNSLYPQTSFLQQPMSSSQDRSIFTPLQQQQQQHHHQQQQQQNFFQQNLFPGGAFGTNTTNALPISMMMQMQNYYGMPGTLFPNNGRQMSNMMPSMVGLPPLTAPARDSSNIAYMQQGLSALMGNQQYPLGVSQSNQNPNFMQQGGWNAGMTTTPRSRPLQQQQDTAVPNEVGNGSQQEQQPNPDFSSMNNFSHYQQI